MPQGSASNALIIGIRLVAVSHKNMEGLRRAQNYLSASGLGTALGTKGEHCISTGPLVVINQEVGGVWAL